MKHTIYFTLTERTRQCLVVEADSLSDAIAAVENGEVDISEGWQVGCFEYSAENISGEVGEI